MRPVPTAAAARGLPASTVPLNNPTDSANTAATTALITIQTSMRFTARSRSATR